MIPIVRQKVKEKFFTKGQGNLALQIAHGMIPELTSQHMRDAGFGYNLVWDTLNKLQEINVLIKRELRRSGRYFKTIYEPVNNHLSEASLFESSPEEKKIKSEKKCVLQYIQKWNELAKKSEFGFKRISEKSVEIYQKEVLAFEKFADLSDFAEAVKELMQFPYFRGENNRGFILHFSFLLKQDKFKGYLDGTYFTKKSILVPNISSKAIPTVKKLVVDDTILQTKIDQFKIFCSQYYPKPGGKDLPDIEKIAVIDRLGSENAFKKVCDQAKASVKDIKYLPQPKNFFDQSYKNNYLKYAPKPEVIGTLSKNHNRRLVRKLKKILIERTPEHKGRFEAVDYRFSGEEDLLEIWGIEEFQIDWLRDNRFDKKIQRILMELTEKVFEIRFLRVL